MSTKRWIAGAAALALAGGGSLFLTGTAMGQDGEHNMDNMEHGDDGHEEETTTTTVPDMGDDGMDTQEPEAAPPVAAEPGFTG